MGEAEKEVKCGCGAHVSMSDPVHKCGSGFRTVSTLMVKRDTNGAWLVQINGDGPWYGARFDHLTNTLQFSY